MFSPKSKKSFETLMPFGGVTFNTIDRETVADNGFLACARRWCAQQRHADHGTSVEALNNIHQFLANGNYGTAHIVGHGNIGFISTGGGQNPTDVLSLYNENEWKDALAAIRGPRLNLIRLIACDTGAGKLGAHLLYDMAGISGLPIYAPTGMFLCDDTLGGRLEDGATWQVAIPGQPMPAPIDVHHAEFRNDYKHLVMQRPSRRQNIDVESIEEFRISYKKRSLVLSNKRDAILLTRTIDFSLPIQIKGALAAVVTGECTITYLDKAEVSHQLTFSIYNNRLFRWVDHSTIYYRCGLLFSNLLLSGIV